MRLLPLIAATYFMVSGGPYGLEDIIGKAGYGRALLLLLAVPLVWSLPTSLMVGELASALPQEGGYYCWVRRALGAFWGFQEAWLSLAALIIASVWKSFTVLHTSAPALMQPPATGYDLAGAVSVALWNYMGWDNASTVAQEVEDPQRNYPRAMFAAAALVAVSYILP